jgi:hypothetical protein
MYSYQERRPVMAVFNNNLMLDEYVDAVRDFPGAKRALCFGDSWFQYVPHPTDLNKRLARLFPKALFLREGKAGRDSATWKAALPRIRDEIESFRFDAILLSTGGNDVVGEELKEFVKTPGMPQSVGTMPWGVVPPEVRDHIRLESFEHALRFAIADLKQVVQMRDRSSPSSVIFVHTYDYIFPSGKAFKLGPFKRGPWVKPFLDEVGLIDSKGQRVVTSWLIDQFARELQSFVSQNPNMVMIDSRGTLKTQSQWENEIHPVAKGFEKIAKDCWKPALLSVLK